MRLVLMRLGIVTALLLLPFVLVFGESGQVTENGRVVASRSINYLGIVLAGTGLVLAVLMVARRSLSPRLDASPTPLWARGAAALLALLCAAQVARSADLLRDQDLVILWEDTVDGLAETFVVWRGLPPPDAPRAEVITAQQEGEFSIIAEEDDEPDLRRLIAITQGMVAVLRERHRIYADACFGGRHRLPDEPLPPLPPRFGAEEQVIIARVREVNLARNPPRRCAAEATAFEMTEPAEEAATYAAGLRILTEGYLRRFGGG